MTAVNMKTYAHSNTKHAIDVMFAQMREQRLWPCSKGFGRSSYLLCV
jgi:hypothetical protein